MSRSTVRAVPEEGFALRRSWMGSCHGWGYCGSVRSEEWTGRAFFFLGDGLSKSCLMNGAARLLVVVLTQYLVWSLGGDSISISSQL